MLNRPVRVIALLLAIALIAGACGGTEDSPATESADTDAAEPAAEPAETEPAPTAAETANDETANEIVVEDPDPTAEPEPAPLFQATLRPSVNQLHVLGAAAGTGLELIRDGTGLADGAADEFGSLLWRDIEPGEYSVRNHDGAESEVVTVWSPEDLPDPDFYADQQIGPGFGYVTTRDGTTLSLNVSLPAGDGPYPTVVEYSGYGPSNPADTTSALLYNTLGFAYVGVNMRGTGCSGGSFQFFEPIQRFDGYDMIEAIAAQSWVEHNAVGMVGVSYPGISQLFVAETQPPSLAAITPLSVIDDTFRSTLYPGGVLNTGFAVDWSNERQSNSAPFGQGWEQGQVDAGDAVCEANQQLRLQNPDALELILDNDFYDPAIGDELSPTTFVDKINVPVFMAGAWQDEQTGGHFPQMIESFTSSPAVFATMVNGSHTESLSPAILERFVAFLELYVARRVPGNAAVLAAPILSSSLTGVSVPLDANPRFSGLDYEAALDLFESDPKVRVLFEEGANPDLAPGAPSPRYEASFDQWPPAGTPTSWYLQADGALAATAPDGTDIAATTYTSDPDALADTIYTGSTGGVWQADVTYDWSPIPDGTGADWLSGPLDADLVAIGTASADLWVQADTPDVDIEVTLSEVRPNGEEVYVQTGWLRASHRAVDVELSTPISPAHTHLAADAESMPDGEYALLRVEIFPFAHAFRAGSQIRLTADAPGGSRPLWAFDETFEAGTTVSIAHDADHPSALVLNIVDGIDVPAGNPACGALRSQPCRTYVELAD